MEKKIKSWFLKRLIRLFKNVEKIDSQVRNREDFKDGSLSYYEALDKQLFEE